jgi:hypothetical protein
MPEQQYLLTYNTSEKKVKRRTDATGGIGGMPLGIGSKNQCEKLAHLFLDSFYIKEISGPHQIDDRMFTYAIGQDVGFDETVTTHAVFELHSIPLRWQTTLEVKNA